MLEQESEKYIYKKMDTDKINEQKNVNIFAEYHPAKLNYGREHPNTLTESATLASVEPADVSYTLKLPSNVEEEGLLSAAQFENVVYACQAHEYYLPNTAKERVGFLIGDGAGVGKGRSLAGIIFENHLRGRRKSVWISCTNDLKHDAKRDLLDIGADNIEVHEMIKVKNK